MSRLKQLHLASYTFLGAAILGVWGQYTISKRADLALYVNSRTSVCLILLTHHILFIQNNFVKCVMCIVYAENNIHLFLAGRCCPNMNRKHKEILKIVLLCPKRWNQIQRKTVAMITLKIVFL